MEEHSHALNGREVYSYDGRLNTIKKKTNLLKHVLDTPDNCILTTTFAAGACGHNWQKFSVVIFLDRSWNPQVFIFLKIYESNAFESVTFQTADVAVTASARLVSPLAN